MCTAAIPSEFHFSFVKTASEYTQRGALPDVGLTGTTPPPHFTSDHSLRGVAMVA